MWARSVSRCAACLLLGAGWLSWSPQAGAQSPGVAPPAPFVLPAEPTGAGPSLPAGVLAALTRAQVEPGALSVVVQEVGRAGSVLEHQALALRNPASLIKLATTAAALDTLGVAYTFQTPVWLAGAVAEGTLHGHLHIQGRGDPKFPLERLWLLLRQVQQQGVRHIAGDIVLDRSHFAPEAVNPADFDGEPLRAYNVQADALLLNFKTVALSFTPDAARGVATVQADPALHGVAVAPQVRLSRGGCGDWRATLQAQALAERIQFAGAFPAACGPRTWYMAFPDAASYNARLIQALWLQMGGTLDGQVREGASPLGQAPAFEFSSQPLGELVREINKHSHNAMAQQIFHALPLVPGVLPPASTEQARQALMQWLDRRVGAWAPGMVIDNGSGLSRHTRVNALLLARLLQVAWASPWMGDLLASLPANGLDGTLRRMRSVPGRAHLKTGSLRDAAGVAGYVLGNSGRRYVVVALINHPRANAARPALEALVHWVLHDGTPAAELPAPEVAPEGGDNLPAPH